MNDADNYLSNNVFRTYATAGFLSAAAMLFGPLLVRIIAGSMLSAGDLAAINLVEPVQRTINALITLLSSGAIVAASYELSKIDDRSASKIFSFSVIACAAAGVVIAISALFCQDWIVSSLCKSQELLPSVRDYTEILLLSAPFLMILPTLSAFISLDGSPKYSYLTIIISQGLSIGIAFLLIICGHRNLSSIAIATLAGNAVGCLFGIYYFVSKSIHFKFSLKPIAKEKAAEVIKLGVPETLSPFLDAVLVFFANAKAMELYGNSGADVMAVCLSMVYIFAFIITGFSLTLKPYGSYLVGMEDIEGYGRFFIKNIMLQQLVMGIVLIPMMMFPNQIMEFFGVTSAEALNLGNIAFPIFVFHYFLCGIIELYVSSFQILKKITYCFAVGISHTIFRIILVLIFYELAPDMFWWSYPLGIALGILVLMICLIIPKLQHRQVMFWTGASFIDAISCKVFSIKCTVSDIKKKLTPINEYIHTLDIDDSSRNRCEHCVEEVLLNTVLFADMQKKERHSTDIKIIVKKQTVSVIFFDDGICFNPFDNIVPEVDLGLEMISKMCPEISYTYLFRQNIINISIPLEKGPVS